MKSCLLGAAVLGLSACTAFAPKLETPKLSIVNVELVKGDLFEQRLRARIRVENPNDRELEVKGITYTIEVGGEEFGRGISGSSFTVPRLGEAEFDMLVSTNFVSGFARLLSRVGGGKLENLDYEIAGHVMLDKGFVKKIPFSKSGQVDVARAGKRSGEI